MRTKSMEALTHLPTLRFFKQATHFATLGAMSFLKERDYLGGWNLKRVCLCEKWQVYERNKGRVELIEGICTEKKIKNRSFLIKLYSLCWK